MHPRGDLRVAHRALLITTGSRALATGLMGSAGRRWPMLGISIITSSPPSVHPSSALAAPPGGDGQSLRVPLPALGGSPSVVLPRVECIAVVLVGRFCIVSTVRGCNIRERASFRTSVLTPELLQSHEHAFEVLHATPVSEYEFGISSARRYLAASDAAWEGGHGSGGYLVLRPGLPADSRHAVQALLDPRLFHGWRRMSPTSRSWNSWS